jgi:hypothetical protein
MHFNKDKRRNEQFDFKSKKSFRKTRFYNKLCKEYFNTFKNTGVSRISIQQQSHDNISAIIEDCEFDEENSTISYVSKENMSMDRRTFREDDLNDSSDRRSVTTHTVSAEGLIKNTAQNESELGINMQLVLYQPRRTTLVGEVHGSKEWITDSEDNDIQSEDNSSCGRIRQRMGNKFNNGDSSGILESGGSTTINKRKRVEDYSTGITTSRGKLRRLNHQNIFRQHDSVKIYDKIGRYHFTNLTGFSDPNTGDMQQIQHQCNLSAHSGNIKYEGRYAESYQETPIRNCYSQENVSHDPKFLGKTIDRCLCCETQSSITKLLVPNKRSNSNSSGRDEAKVVEEGHVPIPSLEDDTTGITYDSETETNQSSSSHTIVVEPVLVSDGIKNETLTTTDNLEDKQQMVSSRLAIINNKRLQDGLDKQTIEFLNKKTRESTHRAYDNGWNHWTIWCKKQQPICNPSEYNPKNVLLFLQDNQSYSSTHLNTLRSSIASVFSITNHACLPIADQPIIKDFFAAKRNSEVKIPTEQQLYTWDVSILVDYIQAQLTPTKKLTLEQLQLKTILLVSIATMWRPRSDIGRLLFRDVILRKNDQVLSVLIHARAPKEGQVKSITLGQYEEPELCPVTTIFEFVTQTLSIRETLPENHTLFLAYIESDKKPVTSIRPATVANWITSAMGKAGIDTTKFQAHSLRAASSTKAVELGHSIQDVKKHANWSLNSNTFEKYYYKPSSQLSSSTSINNSIFSSTDKSITLEVGVESTGIGLGTTSNTNVDETKTENVIHTHPWYKRIFR